MAKMEKEKKDLERQISDEKAVTKTFRDKAATLETQLSQCVVMKDSFFKELSDCRSSTSTTTSTSSTTSSNTLTSDEISGGQEYIKETIINSKVK